MRVRLWNETTCVADKELYDAEYEELGPVSVLLFSDTYYSYQGVFDGAVNFTKCAPPLNVTTWF